MVKKQFQVLNYEKPYALLTTDFLAIENYLKKTDIKIFDLREDLFNGLSKLKENESNFYLFFSGSYYPDKDYSFYNEILANVFEINPLIENLVLVFNYQFQNSAALKILNNLLKDEDESEMDSIKKKLKRQLKNVFWIPPNDADPFCECSYDYEPSDIIWNALGNPSWFIC